MNGLQAAEDRIQTTQGSSIVVLSSMLRINLAWLDSKGICLERNANLMRIYCACEHMHNILNEQNISLAIY